MRHEQKGEPIHANSSQLSSYLFAYYYYYCFCTPFQKNIRSQGIHISHFTDIPHNLKKMRLFKLMTAKKHPLTSSKNPLKHSVTNPATLVRAGWLLGKSRMEKDHFFILTCCKKISSLLTGSSNWLPCSSTQTTKDTPRSAVIPLRLESNHKV